MAQVIASNCGEEYVDEQTSIGLLDLIDQVARAGIQVGLRECVAASDRVETTSAPPEATDAQH